MSLLRTGFDFSDRLSEFISHSRSLFIYVPYVKLESFKQLIDTVENCKLLVVRWEVNDLVAGVSDLEVYDYCKEKNISLYRNPRLHLKAFVDDYKSCLLGSANISTRALNLPVSQSFNFELATIAENLSIDDRLYFNVILNSSTLITDAIYYRLKAEVLARKPRSTEEVEFDFGSGGQNFLISSLPMSVDVPTLLRVFATREATSDIELNCALHDLALYNLSFDLTPKAARRKLKESFFTHPFIKAFLDNVEIDGSIYFGRAKDWIQKNCTDVPTPRKWEITGNIQILYRWIVELGEGKFEVDIPGSRSERLRVLSHIRKNPNTSL